MKKFTYLLIVAGMLPAPAVHAQHARFPWQGTVEYEKSVNMFALIQKRINKDNETYMKPMLESFKRSQPQFKVVKSTLTFNKEKSLFVPEAESLVSPNANFRTPMTEQPNTVFTDLETGKTTVQKVVFEETYLLKDSVRKINWKITTETREIAGYQCRRANAIIMDSIYVVAFYTDKIPVSGGPETFTGLPGMILGVALPHENITWFAKVVTDKSIVPASIAPPVKGKATDLATMKKNIQEAMKSWGADYGQEALKGYSL